MAEATQSETVKLIETDFCPFLLPFVYAFASLFPMNRCFTFRGPSDWVRSGNFFDGIKSSADIFLLSLYDEGEQKASALRPFLSPKVPKVSSRIHENKVEIIEGFNLLPRGVRSWTYGEESRVQKLFGVWCR